MFIGYPLGKNCVEVSIPSADELHRRVWRFDLLGGWSSGQKVHCTAYAEQRRQSKRHKWRSEKAWIRNRNYDREFRAKLLRSCPEVPKHLAQRALDKIRSSIVLVDPNEEK